MQVDGYGGEFRLPWLCQFIQPIQRFNPMNQGTLNFAIEMALKEQSDVELRDHDWPSPWWEEEKDKRERKARPWWDW